MGDFPRVVGDFTVRRVVTGHDEAGRAVVTDTLDLVWVVEGRIVLGLDDSEHELGPGDAVVQRGTPHRWKVAGEGPCTCGCAGWRSARMPNGPGDGWHATSSVDVDLIVSGRMALDLRGGSRTELAPGDVAVQHGTEHRWEPLDGAPAAMVSVMLAVGRS